MKRISTLFLFSLLFFSFGGFATTLTPFNVQYDVYRNNSKIGIANFELNQLNGIWHWDMQTKAQGFYRFLTRKQPFTQTQMQIINNEAKLLLEQTGDYPDKPAKHTTWFDFNSSTLYSMQGNAVKTLELPAQVYNYHSIHLLYPLMLQQQLSQLKVNFYKKGSITSALIMLEKNVDVEHKSKKLVVDRVTQKFENSDKTMVYDYQKGSIAPVRIEQVRPGKDITMMWQTH